VYVVAWLLSLFQDPEALGTTIKDNSIPSIPQRGENDNDACGSGFRPAAPLLGIESIFSNKEYSIFRIEPPPLA
jgi:hypothetical protein